MHGDERAQAEIPDRRLSGWILDFGFGLHLRERVVPFPSEEEVAGDEVAEHRKVQHGAGLPTDSPRILQNVRRLVGSIGMHEDEPTNLQHESEVVRRRVGMQMRLIEGRASLLLCLLSKRQRFGQPIDTNEIPFGEHREALDDRRGVAHSPSEGDGFLCLLSLEWFVGLADLARSFPLGEPSYGRHRSGLGHRRLQVAGDTGGLSEPASKRQLDGRFAWALEESCGQAGPFFCPAGPQERADAFDVDLVAKRVRSVQEFRSTVQKPKRGRRGETHHLARGAHEQPRSIAVAPCGAEGDVLRDPKQRGAGGFELGGGLAVERGPGARRDVHVDGFPDQIVPESERVPIFFHHPRAYGLFHVRVELDGRTLEKTNNGLPAVRAICSRRCWPGGAPI
jgi:hypothetical protein